MRTVHDALNMLVILLVSVTSIVIVTMATVYSSDSKHKTTVMLKILYNHLTVVGSVGQFGAEADASVRSLLRLAEDTATSMSVLYSPMACLMR